MKKAVKTFFALAAISLALCSRQAKENPFIRCKNAATTAAYAITLKQRQRLIKGAAVFVGNQPQYSGYDIRFDAVLVKLPFSIRHLQNAWTA